MNNIWKDSNELQEYLDKYATITGKKTLKKYKEKFGDITMRKWASLSQYYKSIFSSNFITIEEYVNQKQDRKSIKNKKKARRKQRKEDKIKKYRDYINSTKWKLKRAEFIENCNYKCGCCKEIFLDKDLNLHHHTYERLYREKDSDLVVVCSSCHYNIHYVNGKKVKLNEKDLRKSFTNIKKF